jgi:hypothetical protein
MPTPNSNCLAVNFLDPLQERQASTIGAQQLSVSSCPLAVGLQVPERFGYEE